MAQHHDRDLNVILEEGEATLEADRPPSTTLLIEGLY